MIKAIKNRRSIRKYVDKPIEEEKLREVLKAAAYSPSARHIYPWELIIVKENETREELAKSTNWSDFASEAPVIIVVLGDKKKSNELIEDCSIVSEHIMLEASNQDLGTCWIQIRGHEKDGTSSEGYVRELLDIPPNYLVLSMITLGYPEEKKEKHSQKEFQEKKDKYHEGSF